MEKKQKKPIVLCIMDGWGINEDSKNNAVALAKTPNVDFLTKNSENFYFFQFHCCQKLCLSLVEFVVPLFLNQGSYGQPQSFLLDH